VSLSICPRAASGDLEGKAGYARVKSRGGAKGAGGERKINFLPLESQSSRKGVNLPLLLPRGEGKSESEEILLGVEEKAEQKKTHSERKEIGQKHSSNGAHCNHARESLRRKQRSSTTKKERKRNGPL